MLATFLFPPYVSLSFLVFVSLPFLSLFLARSFSFAAPAVESTATRSEQGGKGGKEGSLNRGRQDTAARQGMGRKEVVERRGRETR